MSTDILSTAAPAVHTGARPRRVVVGLSGGVDSGLLASRLLALGYREAVLMNFSFGEDDPEAELARAMAARLGLRYERVFARRPPCETLDAPGRWYPQPFGDHSVVPTAELAHAVIERLGDRPRVIVDGTGADGGFGMAARIEKFSRLAHLPRPLLQAAASVYGAGLWRYPGRIERSLRVLRRSARMPVLSAVLSQNPLAGILYDDTAADEVHARLDHWVAGWAGTSVRDRTIAADLALVCANIFAQKARPLFERAGHRVVYPFLQESVLATAMASTAAWQLETPKAPLKRSLARHVGPEMVYRPKSGFVDPRGKVFHDPEFVAHLRAAGEASSPLHGFVHAAPVRRLCDRLHRRRPLPAQTLNAAWALVFTDRWYRTCDRG